MTTPTTAAGNAERARFEAWAKSLGWVLERTNPNGLYDSEKIQDWWEGWQARAALSQPAPLSDLVHRGPPAATTFEPAPSPAGDGEDAHLKYPNISAISNGTISGNFREWPRIKPEAIALLADLTTARRRLAEARAEGERLKGELSAQTELTANYSASIEEDGSTIRTLRTLASDLAAALEPVMTIHAAAPETPSQSEDFERGCPLTKAQIRAMQTALARFRSSTPAPAPAPDKPATSP